MDTKWTPGPWRDGCDPDGKPLMFATSEAIPGVNANYEHRANMHLLDAAPRLYEELENLVMKARKRLREDGFSEDEINTLLDTPIQALAAARGES